VTHLPRSIVQVSVRYRLLVIAFAAGIIAAGVILLPRMPADVLPETSPVTVDLQTEALGLSGPEVESLVTVPLEKNLLEGIMGVTDVTSDSIPGLSSIELHFAPGTGLYQARQLVQERLTQAFVLPNVSRPPVMPQPVSSTSNVMLIGLTSTRLSLIDLSVLARWTIVPRLLGLDGVANVSTFGQADRQLQVLVDPGQLVANKITLAQVIETAGNAQLVSPLSYLQASTPGTGGYLEDANQRLTIQPVLPFGTPANLAQVPVTGVRSGLQLGKVAQVVQSHQPLIGDGQVRGAPGLVLVVQKLPSASVLAVTREVGQALNDLKPGLPSVTFDTSLFRPASYLTSALGNLRTLLIIAAVLVALALAALLFDLRRAFIAVIAMAVSLASAATALYLLGYTFNALVTLGLLLALAVVVADAVSGGFRGALGGAALAILLSAAPLFFASGLTSSFLRPMVLAFALAVIASIVVALTVTPALASVLRSDGHGTWRGAAPRRRAERGYAGALDRVLRAPAIAMVAVCVVVGVAGLALLPWLHPGQPSFMDRNLVVRWTGAPGMSLTEMNRVTALASAEFSDLPGVQDVGATLGRAVTSDQVVNTNSGEIWVMLKPSADYGRAVAAVREIAEGTPGMNGAVSTYEADSMNGVLSAPPNVVVTRVYGSSQAELERLAGQVAAAMSRVSGVRDPRVQLPIEQPTVDVAVNLDAAQRAGVKPGDVRREAGTLLSGVVVGNFFQDQKVFDVVVWGTPSARASVLGIGSLLVDTTNGGRARLGDIARIAVSPEPADIKHDAMSRYLDVTAQLTGRDAGAVNSAIDSQLRTVKFPLEYHAEIVSAAQRSAIAQGTSRAMFVSYVLAALIGVLLLTHAVLGSWRLAALVFASLPVSLAGGVFTTFAIGAAGSLAASAGLLAVFAVAVRQAIVVTARIRNSAAGGETGGDPVQRARRAAAVGAGEIGVAAVAAALALLPFIAAGDMPGTELPHTAAAVILGGLVTTTLVTLFVLPAACLRFGSTAIPASEDSGQPTGQRPPVGTPA
jgi:Cu/Ag efflux pump CusA